MAPSRRGTLDVGVERAEKIDLESEEREKDILDRPGGVGQSYATQIPTDRVWTMYNDKAAAYDEMLITRLKGSMDSIIIFAGLFSAVVTAFIIESYKVLSVNTGDITIFYLTQISQQLAGLHNASFTLTPVEPPTFLVSRLNVAVNTLWILSLIFSLACALGSTLIQTWTNRYLRRISRSPDAIQRARDRAWYFDGIKKSQMENLADGVPALLHIALFLFLAGLVVFFFPINHDVAYSAMAVSVAFAVIYLVLAAFHILVPNWPYHTPLSLAMTGLCLIIFSPIPIAFYLSFSAVVTATAVAALPLLLLGFLSIKLLKHGFGVDIDFGFIRKMLEDPTASRIPRDVLHPYETFSRIQPAGRDIKRDRNVLKWLLQQTNSVPELEALIEGIEPLIDRDKNHARSAKFVLEVGGESVGTFMTDFGQFVGILIHSCSQQTDLPIEDRQHRLTACTRALISVLTYTTPRSRTADTFLPLTGMISWMPRQSMILPEFIPIRWRQWVTRVTLQGISNLRLEQDPLLSFNSHCLAAVLFHRSLCDVAFRMDSGEVVLEAPTQWDIRSILRAFRGIRKHELFELSVAVSTAAGASEKLSNVAASFGIPHGQWSWKARPIAVTFVPDQLDEEEKIAPILPVKLRNEATLFALYMLLEHAFLSELAPSVAHTDLLHRTISALVTGGSGAGASTELQLTFLTLLMRIYNDDVEEHEVGITAPSGPSTRCAARSLLHSQGVMDLLVPFVETLDDADYASLIMNVRQRLRSPRHTTSPESSITSSEAEVHSMKEIIVAPNKR